MEQTTQAKQNTQDLPLLDLPRKVKLGYSIFGRAVFATEDIKNGELVERCPMEILAFRMNYHKDPVVWSHMFTSTCPCEECKRHGGHILMVMGFAQMYNHQDDHSADIKFDLKNKIADIVARRDIKKGDEIYLNYGPKYFNNRKKITLNADGSPSESAMVESVEGTKEVTSTFDSSKVFKPL